MSEDLESLRANIHRKWNDFQSNYRSTAFDGIKFDITSDKAIVISDLHIPYHREDIIDSLLDIYGNKNFDLYINGDLLDMGCLSSFPKANNITLEREYSIAIEMLNDFRAKFDHVYLVEGNHERRLRNSLMRIPAFIQTSFMFEPDILTSLSEGRVFVNGKLVNVLNFDNVRYSHSFLMKVGKDLMLMHPNNYRQGPGATVKLGISYIMSYDPEIKYVIMGHTHQMAYINYSGVKGYEQGCLSKSLPFESSGRISLNRTQVGFMEVYFDKKNQVVKNIEFVEL